MGGSRWLQRALVVRCKWPTKKMSFVLTSHFSTLTNFKLVGNQLNRLSWASLLQLQIRVSSRWGPFLQQPSLCSCRCFCWLVPWVLVHLGHPVVPCCYAKSFWL